MANIKNRFPPEPADFTGPPTVHEAVTPSDTVNLAQVCRAIYVGVGGTVTCVKLDDTTIQYVGVAGGYILGMFKRVNATGTAATNLVAVG